LNSNTAIWNIVYDEILKKYPEAVIELWFKNFELAHFDDERAPITTTSEGFVDLLNKKYAPEIADIFEQVLNFRLNVKIYAKSKFNPEEIPLTESAPAPAEKIEWISSIM
jgi:chromosomal replication initiation ATPase DnaA